MAMRLTPAGAGQPHSLIAQSYAGKPNSQVTYLSYPVIAMDTKSPVVAKLLSRECFICSDIPHNPHIVCREDTHQFCKKCAEDYYNLKPRPTTCPSTCKIEAINPPTLIRSVRDAVKAIEIHCPYSTSCHGKITIEDIAKYEEFLEKSEKPKPLSAISQHEQDDLGLTYYRVEERLDLLISSKDKMPDDRPSTHLARCPWRPMECRGCKQVMSEIQLKAHIEKSQCKKSEKCTVCEKGYLKEDALFHLSKCLPDSLDQKRGQIQSPQSRTAVLLEQAATCIEHQKKFSMKLAGEVANLTLKEKNLEGQVSRANTNWYGALRERNEANDKIKQTQAERDQYANILLIQTKKLAVSDFKNAQHQISESLEKAQKAKTKKAATPKILAQELKKLHTTKCIAPGSDFNYLNSDSPDEIILHIQELPDAGKEHQNHFNLAGYTVTFSVRNNQNIAEVRMAWRTSDQLQEGQSPDASIQLDVYSHSASDCFSRSIEFKPDQAEGRIQAGTNASKFITLAQIPAPQLVPSSDGAQAIPDRGGVVIRLAVKKNTGAVVAPAKKSKK